MSDKNSNKEPSKLSDIPLEERSCGCGRVDKTKASLLIFGENLIPEHISELVKCEPTISRRKGESIKSGQYETVFQEGCWIIEGGPENVDLEDQIICLLNRVTDDLEVWNTMANQYRINISCGLFLYDLNRGFRLSHNLQKMLSDRKLEIQFDIYYVR